MYKRQFQWREKIYEIYEQICGARLTTNIGRIGGFERDFTDDVNRRINEFIEEFPAALKEFEKMVLRNRIFMDRTINVGSITAEKALDYGFTGPNLRAAGGGFLCVSYNKLSEASDGLVWCSGGGVVV